MHRNLPSCGRWQSHLTSEADVEDKRNHEHGDRTPTRRATKPKTGVTGLCEMANSVEANTVRAIQNGRSEEHTSELQSLMRISYAVFCLKKKKTPIPKQNYQL